MPTLTYGSGFRLNFTGSWIVLESLNVIGAANTPIIQMAADMAIVRCRVENTGTGLSAVAIGNDDLRCIAFESDAILSGASGGTCAIAVGAAGSKAIGCRVRVTSTCPGIIYSVYTVVYDCTIFASGGIGAQASATTTSAFVCNNTFVGCVSDGLNLMASTTVLSCVINNMLTDSSGGYGLNLGNTTTPAFMAYNRTRDNSLGGINSGTGWVNATNYGPITSGSGASSDYVSPGSTNFNYLLISTSPAVNAAGPSKASMGANQFVGSGAATQTSYGSAQ